MSYCSVIYCCDIATFNIASLQCERFCTNESVLFISDVLFYCLVMQRQVILLQCESPLMYVFFKILCFFFSKYPLSCVYTCKHFVDNVRVISQTVRCKLSPVGFFDEHGGSSRLSGYRVCLVFCFLPCSGKNFPV